MRRVNCLTIAGSDPSGGAGIQGDLKTFTVLGAYGMAVITALTAQNTQGVTGVHESPPDFVALQLKTLFADVKVHAAKTGMLATAEIIEAVVANLPDGLPLVVDPVMVSTSGSRLLEASAVEAIKSRLLPRAWMATPNAPEAEVLTGICIRTVDDAVATAEAITGMGVEHVLVKGGDSNLEPGIVVDVFRTHGQTHILREDRIDTIHTHGSGCALASALCVAAGRGYSARESVDFAREFIQRAILTAKKFGEGHGPVNHLWPLEAQWTGEVE
ncbi:bifunctional hydroxymethylpyrimidine kinase/phosphomethylpyrimidine kinase [candidate division BRC1 bacterium HGW-BRC1-1]|nr:MAG: bifunctional hydroxymethylpyrimidine kinase/phosphomethylpyrimidine kinase [candidate division BRC1 bacterium HGW-BRC1-1]